MTNPLSALFRLLREATLGFTRGIAEFRQGQREVLQELGAWPEDKTAQFVFNALLAMLVIGSFGGMLLFFFSL